MYAKKGIVVDVGSIWTDGSQLVTFKPIDELIAYDDDICLRYQLSRSYRPRSGDWIGLFQLSQDSPNDYLYLGFRWAQKHPWDKQKPFERTVFFKLNEVDIQVDSGADSCYKFLYMTASERMVGCTNSFRIRHHVPLFPEPIDTATQLAVVQQQTKAIVTYDFFHQKYFLMNLKDNTIHLCYADVTAGCCILFSGKNPLPHLTNSHNWRRQQLSIPLTLTSPSNSSCECERAKEVLKLLRTKLCWMKSFVTKQDSSARGEINKLRDQVNRLKSREISLRKALEGEQKARRQLMNTRDQTEDKFLQKVKEMTNLLNNELSVAEKQVEYQNLVLLEAGFKNKAEVHINQTLRQGFGNSTGMTSHNKSPKHSAPDSKISKKVSRPGKDNDEENSSESEVFGNCTVKQIGKKLQQGVINQYSGSNISLRRLFDERLRDKLTEASAFTSSTYSGSNLSLSNLFNEVITNATPSNIHKNTAATNIPKQRTAKYVPTNSPSHNASTRENKDKDIRMNSKYTVTKKDHSKDTEGQGQKSLSKDTSFKTNPDPRETHATDKNRPSTTQAPEGKSVKKQTNPAAGTKNPDHFKRRSEPIQATKIISPEHKAKGATIQRHVNTNVKKEASLKVGSLFQREGNNRLPIDQDLLKAGTLSSSSPARHQTTTEFIQPTKSLTVSVVPQTGGKLQVSVDGSSIPISRIAIKEISREARSVSGLESRGVNNEASVKPTTFIKSSGTPNRLQENEDAGGNDLIKKGIIRAVETTNISSTGQLTHIDSIHILTISNPTISAITQPTSTADFTTPNFILTQYEDGKEIVNKTPSGSVLDKSKSESSPVSTQTEEETDERKVAKGDIMPHATSTKDVDKAIELPPPSEAKTGSQDIMTLTSLIKTQHPDLSSIVTPTPNYLDETKSTTVPRQEHVSLTSYGKNQSTTSPVQTIQSTGNELQTLTIPKTAETSTSATHEKGKVLPFSPTLSEISLNDTQDDHSPSPLGETLTPSTQSVTMANRATDGGTQHAKPSFRCRGPVCTFFSIFGNIYQKFYKPVEEKERQVNSIPSNHTNKEETQESTQRGSVEEKDASNLGSEDKSRVTNEKDVAKLNGKTDAKRSSGSNTIVADSVNCRQDAVGTDEMSASAAEAISIKTDQASK